MARKKTGGRIAGRARKQKQLIIDAASARAAYPSAGRDPRAAEEAAGPVGHVAPAASPAVAVEVDQAQLAAEAAAIVATFPATAQLDSTGAAAESAAPGTAVMDPAARAAEIEPVVIVLVDQLCDFGAPNWRITTDEKSSLGKSLSMVLAYWMPETNLDPKWMALAAFAGSAWAIARERRTESGWKPLRVAPPREDRRPKVGEAVDIPPATPPGPAPLRL